MKFRVLPERLAVCRLASGSTVPAWALQGVFFCVVRAVDELSIVCPEDLLPYGATAERGWAALKLDGPFPFSMAGVLASFLEPLAEAEIPIFAISTFDTDYVLIKCENLKAALIVLDASGHAKIDGLTR